MSTVSSTARIHETGYRPYDGPRRGQVHAAFRLGVQTTQRVLGLRRPARSKVLPLLSIVIAFLPAAVFLGLAALLPRRATGVLPPVDTYYGFIIAAILLFVAFSAPEALAADRRSRTVSLYLASPLTRTTYLAAVAGGIAATISVATVGPPLVYIIGLVLQGAGPDGFLGFLSLLGRVLLAGTAMSLYYTAIAVGIATLTDRRALAAAATILAFTASGFVANGLALVEGSPQIARLISLARIPTELVARIYGKPGVVPGVSSVMVLVVAVGVSTASAGLAWWSYHRLQVTR